MKKFDTLFLDRDGVLNKKIEEGYVLAYKDIEIIPEIKDFLLTAVNYFDRILVVTNQRCVGRGLLSIEQLALINEEVNRLTGGFIGKFYVCPHLGEDNCVCRKPKDGLFLNAQRDYPVIFERSWMIGDSVTDIIPAKKLGIYSCLISDIDSVLADKVVGNVAELIPVLEGE
jgi:D-glycero-D-manno-heptose 1,7-bisphosphate phosphatase